MLLNTFSPKMVKTECNFVGKTVSLKAVKEAVVRPYPWSNNRTGFPGWLCDHAAISHENTAQILSVLLQAEVKFNRENVSMSHGDEAWVIVPNFRATEAREFSQEEIMEAGISCYHVKVYDPSKPRFHVIGQADDVGGSPCNGGYYNIKEEAEKAMVDMLGEGFYPAWVVDYQSLEECE